MDNISGAAQTGTGADARRHYRQGALLLKEHRFEEARRELVAALKLVPKFPEALRALALVHKAMGQADEASKFFNAAAMACVHLGRCEEAGKLYESCRAAGLVAENPYKRAADALRGAGRHQQSLKLYERALELDPADETLAAGYVMAKSGAGDVEGAHRFLRSYLAQHPEAEEVLRARVSLSELPGDSPVREEYRRTSPEDLLREEEAQVQNDEDGFDIEEEGAAPPAGKSPAKPAEPRAESPKRQQIIEEEPCEPCGKDKRRSRRIPMADYSVRYARRKDPLPVIDICREGVGFKRGEVAFEKGQKLTFDIMGLEKVRIKKLQAVVRHVTGSHVGCEFVKLSDKQRKLIDDLLFADDEKEDPFKSLIGDGKEISFDIDAW